MEKLFVDDYCTLKEAADRKGASYEALRWWVRMHHIPTRRVGKSVVVRLSDLVGYAPRGTRSVLSAQ
jgi:hypothetical protein